MRRILPATSAAYDRRHGLEPAASVANTARRGAPHGGGNRRAAQAHDLERTTAHLTLSADGGSAWGQGGELTPGHGSGTAISLEAALVPQMPDASTRTK